MEKGDILPTGYMGAELCDISPGDVVAVGGAGPVGLFAVGQRLPPGGGAGHRHRPLPYRLELARSRAGAETVDYEGTDVNNAVPVMGAYGGMVDKFPMGAVMNRSLTIRSGQWHIRTGRIDPTLIVTHRMGLDEAPSAYEMLKEKQDECVKVVLTPRSWTSTICAPTASKP